MEPAAGVTDQNITKGGREGREFDDNISIVALYFLFSNSSWSKSNNIVIT